MITSFPPEKAITFSPDPGLGEATWCLAGAANRCGVGS
jgi:hypothetical protein